MLSGEGPIYQQLADRVAEDILAGVYPEESAVPSTNEYSVFYQVSPITVAKGLHILVDDGVLYLKRGVGMFVAPGARARLQRGRRDAFIASHIVPLTREAALLHITRTEITDMIDKEFDNDHGD